MRRHRPFRIALETFEGRLARGDWPMGMPLQIQPLAEELRFSTTPIREALAFLAGQGVIEATQGSGYLTLRMDARQLAQAYDLHRLLVDAALNEASNRANPSSRRDPDVAPELDLACPAAVFTALVARGRNASLARAHRGVTLLLGRARLAEARVFAGWREEIRDLWRTCGEVKGAAASHAVKAYHDHRLQNLPEIVLALED